MDHAMPVHEVVLHREVLRTWWTYFNKPHDNQLFNRDIIWHYEEKYRKLRGRALTKQRSRDIATMMLQQNTGTRQADVLHMLQRIHDRNPTIDWGRGSKPDTIKAYLRDLPLDRRPGAPSKKGN
jgi:hypothetical protein